MEITLESEFELEIKRTYWILNLRNREEWYHEGKTGDSGPRISESGTSELELAEMRREHNRG